MPTQSNKMTTATATPPKTTTDTVSVNIPLPAELHKQLRIKAAMEDLTIKDAVISAVEDWVS
jgi:hypothetical protein